MVIIENALELWEQNIIKDFEICQCLNVSNCFDMLHFA
jgi:hypothetical protein